MTRSSTLPRPVATVAALGLALLPMAAGCGRQPQLASGNRDLITSLATAVSTRNTAWLDENVKLIEARRAAGGLAEGEYEALSSIVATARSGDWQGAEAAVYALRDAQEPTAEDLKRLSERKLAPDHGTAKKAARPGG